VSDQHDAGSPAELTPAQESTVRRLLSEARHDQPLPTEVADRLDRVLADLPLSAPSAPVIDLAARRRRRNAGKLLVAAAAVILGGVGVGEVLGGSRSDDDTASDSATSEQAPDRDSGDAQSAKPNSPELDASGGSSTMVGGLEQRLPLDLSSQRLAADVEDQLADLPSATKSHLSEPSTTPGRNYLAGTPGFSCPPPSPRNKYATDELFPAYYDGVPVVLALKAVPGGTQSGQLLECQTGVAVASFSVSLR
jgi:hypothetical protein